MKLALVGPVHPFRGGIAHYTSMLAQALGEQTHEVLVVSYRRQYPRWLYPGKSDREPSMAPAAWQVPAEFTLDTLWPPTWRQASRRLCAFEPDLVVLQWWTTFMGPLTWWLARDLRRAGLRVAFVIHNVLPHEPRPGDAWLTRRVLRLGQAFLVQSQSERTRLHGLLPEAQAQVVAHPIYTMFGEQTLSRAAARQQLGLSAEAGLILFFGIVRPYKGLHTLVQALALLHGAGVMAHLLVAGEFWEDRRGYEREIAAVGLQAYVHLTDHYIPNEAVGTYFAAADVFAAPYVGGTQSGAITVALHFGLPVVTTRKQDVAGQSAGPLGTQVVPPGDAAALAEALSLALSAQRARANDGPVQASRPSEVPGWQQLARAVAQMGNAR